MACNLRPHARSGEAIRFVEDTAWRRLRSDRRAEKRCCIKMESVAHLTWPFLLGQTYIQKLRGQRMPLAVVNLLVHLCGRLALPGRSGGEPNVLAKYPRTKLMMAGQSRRTTCATMAQFLHMCTLVGVLSSCARTRSDYSIWQYGNAVDVRRAVALITNYLWPAVSIYNASHTLQ